MAPTHWSFGQLCSLVGAPAGYLRQLPAALAGINMQHGLLSHRAELIKTLEADDGRVELRAVTGPDYGRIWDHELVSAVMKIAGDGVGERRTRPGYSAFDAAAERFFAQSSPDRLQAVASPYVVQAGTLIAGALLTGIRSDLPGQITAQVTQNVYDSPSGRYLLIPQGAKLIGIYDSQVSFGQSRVLLAWTRLIMPNGHSIRRGSTRTSAC